LNPNKIESFVEVEAFLTAEEEQQIVEAIIEAENKTSGEIRVHLEKAIDKDAIERAQEVFFYLGMDGTQNQNGILFYVAVDDHRFAVIGDKGIDKVVPDDFWESIRDEVIGEFKSARYANGLVQGILHAGEKLKEFFPIDEADQNELPDSISKNH
jgi:uncharacterized membrane protein